MNKNPLICISVGFLKVMVLLTSYSLLGQVSTQTNNPPVVSPSATDSSGPVFGTVTDFHGYVCHNFPVEGSAGVVVAEPKVPLPGRLWGWRPI